jgi:hypothetical protein
MLRGSFEYFQQLPAIKRSFAVESSFARSYCLTNLIVILIKMQYTYSPLQFREIRLISVLPEDNSSGGTLQCCLIHVSLDDPHKPAFSALSYTWGDPNRKVPIMVNGKRFDLIESAYQPLSTATTGVNLWIDSICINQDDNDEKSKQVPLMADIYSLANSTDVWLGPEGEDSALAVEFLLELKEVLPTIVPPTGPNATLAELEVARRTAEAGTRKWVALNKLLNRPWFSRVWVIQEVVLSTGYVQFIVGNHGIAWSDVIDVLEHLNRLDSVSLIGSIPEGPIDALTMATFPLAWTQIRLSLVLASKRQNNDLSLEESMQFALTCQATNPRDKIYGLYGMAGVTDPEIAADYNKSVEDVFLQVTAYCITQNESLRLLSDAGLAWKDRMPSLPSWVPNYQIYDRPCERLGSPAENGYKAGGGGKPVFNWDDSSDDFIVRGILIDTVQAMSSCYPHHLERPKFYLSTFIPEVFKLLGTAGLDPDDPDVRESLWRTLLADRDENGEDPSPEYAEWFDSFVHFHTHLADFAEGFSTDDTKPVDSATTERMRISMQSFRFKYRLDTALVNRRFCITDGGRMGLVPDGTIVGDTVAVFLGAEVPFILRKAPNFSRKHRRVQLVSECYIHELMDGGALELGQDCKITLQ